MANLISTVDLVFDYNQNGVQVEVLRGLNIDISSGQFVAVVGHNGSGKSTLAKHFNGLLLPTGGSVYVMGIDTADQERIFDIRQAVGMVFQNPDNQIVATVVEEDVAFAPENLGIPSKEIRARVDDALRSVGMYEYRLHSPHMLSGGQKQRIAIAGAIAMMPKCLVFDEPTAMLDPVGRNEVMACIRKLNSVMGITVVLITHHMDEAAQADRVVVLSEGSILLDGKPSEVFCNIGVLESAGLDVPQTVRLLSDLRNAGYDLTLDNISVDDCAGAIFDLLKERCSASDS